MLDVRRREPESTNNEDLSGLKRSPFSMTNTLFELLFNVNGTLWIEASFHDFNNIVDLGRFAHHAQRILDFSRFLYKSLK